ncbi:MAG: DUF2163 domain-containing protein [Rickettsiales bacterium]|nr:DUF2163 domain-containing protein [Rickettsiales bacterium]
MHTLTSAFNAHLQTDVTTLATCWKITRRDSTIMGFTDHDTDIELSGVTYLASSGFTPTAVQNSSALNVDNLDVQGLLDSAAITEEDLLAGVYDFAEVECFVLNYEAPDDGTLPLRTGWIGEVTVNQGEFIAEIRGLTQRLGQTIGQLYSPTCRAQLGDSRCGVTLGSFTVTGTVTASTDRNQLTDSGRSEDDGYFAYGVVSFTSGANTGLSMEVKQFSNGSFILMQAMPHTIEAGDTYSAIAGCDKRIATCASVFSNAANFRGEPHVPGTDRILETSTTRNE